MKNLSIDEKLEIVREFMQEKGAKVGLSIYRMESKAEAEEIASRYAEKFGTDYQITGSGTSSWISFGYRPDMDMTIYYELSKEDKKAQLRKQLQMLEEDVDLSGMKDEVSESA